jgi:hypothetical protein
MRYSVEMLLVASCAAMLVCAPAYAQEAKQQPLPPEPAHVIHQDLPTDKCPEPEAPACEAQRWWGQADVWLAWIRGVNFPTLVTFGATSDPLPGALGQSGTAVRFSGDQSPHERVGMRFKFGGWFDEEGCYGAMVSGSFLASRTVGFGEASPGTPVIARPFFDVNGQQQNSSLVSFPGLASGTIGVRSGTSLYGLDANFVADLLSTHDFGSRLLAGFRYFDLHDDLTIDESVLVDPLALVLAGQHIGVHDNFACDNYFYGGNLGLSGAYTVRRFEFDVTAQCALGLTQQCVNIAGATRIDGAPVIPAGLLAVSSNSGSHVHNTFTVVPELDVDARFEVTRHFIVSIGYSVLYWSNVARAGQQVDTNINLNLVPTSNTFGQPGGPREPQALIRETNFWAQGVHFGLEVRF